MGDIFTWPLRGDRIIGLRQCAFCILLHPVRFCGTRHLLPVVLRDDLAHRSALAPPQALFFGTGFERAPRIGNPSNRIEATGFATNKEFRWPRVPLLPSFPPLNLLLSVRRRWHASRDP